MEKIFSSWSHMGRKSKSVDYFLSDFVEEENHIFVQNRFLMLRAGSPSCKNVVSNEGNM